MQMESIQADNWTSGRVYVLWAESMEIMFVNGVGVYHEVSVHDSLQWYIVYIYRVHNGISVQDVTREVSEAVPVQFEGLCTVIEMYATA